jgi:MoxR-like ATPase
MPIFDSITETFQALRDVGYITDMDTASTVFFAARKNKPLLIEGPPGAGKTELANSISRAGNMPFLRLQCYEGIDPKQAIGDFNKSLQDLYVIYEQKTENHRPFDEIGNESFSRKFYTAGPLLMSLENKTRCVLLIDEIDKVNQAFEASLLEMLSEWQLTVSGLGVVRANTKPFVVITSNAERQLGFALRRRCLYTTVEHPTPEREAEIVALKVPNASPALHRFIAGLAIAMRNESLEKPPSISEMISVAEALDLIGQTEILPEQKMMFLPMLVKTMDDRTQFVKKEGMFRYVLDEAKLQASCMNDDQINTILYLDGPNDEIPALCAENNEKKLDTGAGPEEPEVGPEQTDREEALV